tara:strand:- start:191 stop:409 length:219 start_codon:yes stop_codon:yes gene_type:complete
MTKQEENWELMTILHIPWHEANKIDDESDRKFLLTKCEQVKEMMKRQQQIQEEQQRQMESQLATPESKIVAP